MDIKSVIQTLKKFINKQNVMVLNKLLSVISGQEEIQKYLVSTRPSHTKLASNITTDMVGRLKDQEQ
mgnify:CR=1 FL=1